MDLEKLINAAELLGVDVSRGKIILYFLSHCNFPGFDVFCTADRIAKDLNMNINTVTKAMKFLKDEGYIEKLAPGHWKVGADFRACVAGASATKDDDPNFLYLKHYID